MLAVALSGNDRDYIDEECGRFPADRSGAEVCGPIVLESGRKIHGSLSVRPGLLMGLAPELNGNECLQHSFGVGGARRDTVKRLMAVGLIYGLGERDERFSTEKADSLELLFRGRFLQATPHLVQGAVDFGPAGLR